MRQHLRRCQRPIIVPHLVNDAPETVGVVRASANDHPNVFDIKRSMTRQHAILDTIDVKARDTACRIMRRRHMVQPPRFKGRLPDHFLIVEFIGEVIPQIPRTRDRQVIRFKPQPHNEINRLRCEVVTNDESLKRQRAAQPAGLIISPHRTRAAKTQRVAQRAILNPRHARSTQRARPAAHRGHIFHSHASSRTEGPVQIDAAAKNRGPEAHLTRRTTRAGDPDRPRPTLWPSVADRTHGAGLTSRPVYPRPRPTLRPGVAAKAGGALHTGLAARPGVADRPGLTLEARITNRPSCTLDTCLTARPGVPNRPGCTWRTPDTRLTANARPTLRPGVADKAGGALRAGLTARPGVPDRPGLTLRPTCRHTGPSCTQ